ncbi:anti-repressor protein, partial [Bacillus thuringiensis Sbt003]
MVKSNGGLPKIEYVLTLNMAKELAMVENNKQGRKVRRYFIEVEERVSGKKQSKPRKKSVNLIFRQEIDIAKTLASMTGVKEGIAYAVAMERAEQKTGEDFSSYKRLLPAATHVHQLKDKHNINFCSFELKLSLQGIQLL